MSIRKIALAVAALLFTVSIASAQQSAPPTASKTAPAATANVTGTWNGTLKPDGEGGKSEEQGLLVLKQEGDVVTGTAGPNVDQRFDISKGKLVTTKDGTVLTFELSNPNGMVMQFEMKLADGHLKGSAKAERDGQKMTAAVDFTRAK